MRCVGVLVSKWVGMRCVGVLVSKWVGPLWVGSKACEFEFQCKVYNVNVSFSWSVWSVCGVCVECGVWSVECGWKVNLVMCSSSSECFRVVIVIQMVKR